MQTKNVSCVGLMAWGSPMSESRNSNIYVFEICRLWCKGCHRRKKSDPWPLLYYLYTCISPEGKILDKGGCCMYWVASTVSPTFLCFYVDHACSLIEYCWLLALTSLHGMSIISVKLQSFHGEEVQTKLLRMFLLKFT